MEYKFNLKFKLAPENSGDEHIMKCLSEAGCTDALVGLGLAGYVGLDFIREADSAQAAILSAIADVETALPKAKLVEAGPDFVGLTDAADLVGMSRQNSKRSVIYVLAPTRELRDACVHVEQRGHMRCRGTQRY